LIAGACAESTAPPTRAQRFVIGENNCETDGRRKPHLAREVAPRRRPSKV